MTTTAYHLRNRSSTVAAEEDRAWVSFYQRIPREPSLAAEVLTQLDADPDMKHLHLALYLSCRESLRVHREREERHQRIGAFVRWLLGGLLVQLPRRTAARAAAIAVACLPQTAQEPAANQVRRLTRHPKIRAAKDAFKASGTTAAAPGVQAAAAQAETLAPEPKLAQAS